MHGSLTVVYCLGALLGLFSVPTYPIVLELAIELSFPISEEFSTIILTVLSSITTVGIHFLFKWELTGLFYGLSTLILLFMKPEYKRLFFEKEPARKRRVDVY